MYFCGYGRKIKRKKASIRPPLHAHGQDLGGKLLLRAQEGGCPHREGEDDHIRRIQRHTMWLRERVRGREQQDQTLRPTRRGQRHHEGGPLLQ